MQIEVTYLPIFSVKPYEKNPRRNDDAVDAVAASIREFGFKVPIVVDKDGIIIAGHTRYKAAVKLGLCEVPCVKAEHLTPKQVKAYRLADNKTGELAEWDSALLNFELSSLEAVFDMTQFGFSVVTPKKDKESSTVGTEEDDDVIICPKCKRPFSRKEGQHLDE